MNTSSMSTASNLDHDLLALIDSVAPSSKAASLTPSEMLERLKRNNPQLVMEAQGYAVSGYTVAAIGNATSLGFPAIEAILSEEVPVSLAERFKESIAKSGGEIPNRAITYADIRTSMGATRRKQQVSLADNTTKLRNVLVNRALELMNSGHGNSLRDVVSALRVVGVPTAGSVTESPAASEFGGKVPPKFIIDSDGRYAPNPDYQTYIAKGNNINGAGTGNVVIHIGSAAYERAGSAGVGSVVDTDNEGNIISVTRPSAATSAHSAPATRSLQSMSATEMHKLASGSDKGLRASEVLSTRLDGILGDKNATVTRGLSK